jgi:hypothetical protein
MFRVGIEKRRMLCKYCKKSVYATMSNSQNYVLPKFTRTLLNIYDVAIQQSTVQGPDSERHSISDRTVNTGALLIAQIHGYLLGLKSIKPLIVGLQKI